MSRVASTGGELGAILLSAVLAVYRLGRETRGPGEREVPTARLSPTAHPVSTTHASRFALKDAFLDAAAVRRQASYMALGSLSSAAMDALGSHTKLRCQSRRLIDERQRSLARRRALLRRLA